MKILFISSGNSDKGISPIVKAQGESLVKAGLGVDYHTIKGRGVLGYLRNARPLREIINKNNYDVCHSHYSLCGFVTALSIFSIKNKPNHICSLMGSDVNSSMVWMGVTRYFAKYFWDTVIVKSEDMKRKLKAKDTVVIPNGVDLEVFKPMDRELAREKLELPINKKIILFGADPKREVKNYPLAKEAFDLVDLDDCDLLALGNVDHKEVALYINSADVLLLTSKWEGSPNIIKEAMACNCPIVSTDVGDVRWLLGKIEGHYIAESSPESIAIKLKEALEYGRKTKGRERLKELELDSDTVAERLIDAYKVM